MFPPVREFVSPEQLIESQLISSHEKRVSPPPGVYFPAFGGFQVINLVIFPDLNTNRPDILKFAAFCSYRISVPPERDISFGIIT
jgi:hypothetical protein